MKLSFIFELLLVFILIAFAASAVIDKSHLRNSRKGAIAKKNVKVAHKRQESPENKYCSCSTKLCNCCREFNLPVVALRGPGCATLQYLTGDRLAISMSMGERVLTNTTISSKRPDPICMPLPGGVSKFCGRVYNIARKGENFNACLGLELRAANEIEAAMRVSCFRFGPQGLKLEPPQPLPVVEEEDDDNDDEDDDDDYDEDDDDSEDYGTFGVLDDDFISGYFGGDAEESSSGNRKRRTTTTTTTTTKAPFRRIYTRKPVATKPLRKKVVSQKPKPIRVITKVPSTKAPSTIASTQLPSTSSMMSYISVNEVVLPQNQNMSLIMQMGNNDNVTKAVSNTSSLEITTKDAVVTTIQTEMPLDTTTVTTLATELVETTTQAIDDDSQEEDDPLAEAVEDVINDEESGENEEESEEESDEDSDESSEESIPQLTTIETKGETTTVRNDDDKKEGKDIFDDIADGVEETLGDDDDEEDDEDDEDEEEDDDEDEDELFRSLKSLPKVKSKSRSRQSRVMKIH